MSSLEALAAVQPATPATVTPETLLAAPTSVGSAVGVETFARLMQTGVADMQAQIDRANDMVRAYALDENMPVHEVMIALEEARISVELGLQVRSRLVEAYRDIMNMQL